MAAEFLPLCDVLFNIISLTSYFCDVVFDCVTIYTLYAEGKFVWFYTTLGIVLSSLFISQVCSIIWHLDSYREGRKTKPWILAFQHFFLGGVLMRYFMLFVPVDLRHVKHEVRDLCVLRMLHGFCESAPMLLVQLFLIWKNESVSEITELNLVSTGLSLFNVCWALASFNKNLRKHNVHRLVLTWLGVICQLLWRLGTITSRSLSLTVYATLYGYWVLLVIALHWLSMFLWLISPKNVFHGEKLPFIKKMGLSMLIAFCYIFCYVNIQEISSRHKMAAFYFTMLLENTLLVSVWLGSLRTSPWYQHSVTFIVFISFALGIMFMLLYYRHFHVKRLQQYHQTAATTAVYHCSGCRMDECSDKSHRMPFPYYLNELSASDNSTIASDSRHVKVNNITQRPYSHRPRLHYITNDSLQVAGVFNCKFNPAIKRKKKKPTSFVPSPPPILASLNIPNNTVAALNGRNTPFWKKPISYPTCSDHEGSIGSRVNIQQKLQEKKKQQIAELHQIEEEIRSGKLKRPHPAEISNSETLSQIPKAKKQPWGKTEPPIQYPYFIDEGTNEIGSFIPRKKRSQTPEILLVPHYLENSRIYYEYQDPRWKYGNNYHLPSDEISNSSCSKRSTTGRKTKTRNKKIELPDRDKVIYKSVRASSDLDSQISLPRSNTLPREFKYYRRPENRKYTRNDHIMSSTNSSDGDVDSCDEADKLSSPAASLMTLHRPSYILQSPSMHHQNLPYHTPTNRLIHLNRNTPSPRLPPTFPPSLQQLPLPLPGGRATKIGKPHKTKNTHETKL